MAAEMTKVTIIFCGGSERGKELETTHAADPWSAMGQAITQHWGDEAYFHGDVGLSDIGRYGQIFKKASTQGHSAYSVSDRVRIETREV